MKALLLAAGRGQRMRPLSDTTPKPLLRAGGRTLIEWQIMRLVRAGIRDLVINLAHCADMIEAALGDGSQLGARIQYAREGHRAEDALETLGGVVNALPLLSDDGNAPILIVASDVYTEFDYQTLVKPAAAIAQGAIDAHLVLVDNPPYHRQGDLGLSANGLITRTPPLHTYASLGVYAARLFESEPTAKKPLFPWMHQWIDQGRVHGEYFSGVWHNVGTPQDLSELDASLQARTPAEHG